MINNIKLVFLCFYMIFFLACSSNERGTDYYIMQLETKDSNKRIEAVQKLGVVDFDGKVVVALVKALNDPDWEVKMFAASSLANYGTAANEAIPALIVASHDKEVAVRMAAIRALGYIGENDIAAISAVASLLKDTDEKTRLSGIVALRHMGEKARDVIPLIQDMLKKEQLESKAAAAHIIFTRNAKLTVAMLTGSDGLIALLSDSDWEARKAAVKELKKYAGKDGVIDALISALNDQVCAVRVEACRSLDAIGPNALKALKTLREISNNDNCDELRWWAEMAIKSIAEDN